MAAGLPTPRFLKAAWANRAPRVAGGCGGACCVEPAFRRAGAKQCRAVRLLGGLGGCGSCAWGAGTGILCRGRLEMQNVTARGQQPECGHAAPGWRQLPCCGMGLGQISPQVLIRLYAKRWECRALPSQGLCKDVFLAWHQASESSQLRAWELQEQPVQSCAPKSCLHRVMESTAPALVAFLHTGVLGTPIGLHPGGLLAPA